MGIARRISREISFGHRPGSPYIKASEESRLGLRAAVLPAGLARTPVETAMMANKKSAVVPVEDIMKLPLISASLIAYVVLAVLWICYMELVLPF
jgi:hypothetical protein